MNPPRILIQSFLSCGLACAAGCAANSTPVAPSRPAAAPTAPRQPGPSGQPAGGETRAAGAASPADSSRPPQSSARSTAPRAREDAAANIGAYADPAYRASIVAGAPIPEPIDLEMPRPQEQVRHTSGRYGVTGARPTRTTVQEYREPPLTPEQKAALGEKEEFDELKVFYRPPPGTAQGVDPIAERPRFGTNASLGGTRTGQAGTRTGALVGLNETGRSYGNLNLNRSEAKVYTATKPLTAIGWPWGVKVGDAMLRLPARRMDRVENW